MKNKTQYIIIKQSPCPKCNGTGVLQHPAWKIYWDQFGEDGCRRTSEEDRIWFSERGYREIPPEEQPCFTCNGVGIIRENINLCDALKEIDGSDLWNIVDAAYDNLEAS